MKALQLLRRKDGMALLTVLIIFLVLVIMLGGISVLTNSNLRQSETTKENTAAFYSSEAGLTKVSSEFETKLDDLVNHTPSLTSAEFLTAVNTYISSHSLETVNLSANNGNASYADVSLVSTGVDGSGYQTYLITSNGYVGEIERVLLKTYKFKYTEATSGSGFIIDKAVLVKNNITVDSPIYGAPIGTYSTNNGSIRFNSSGSVPGINIPQDTVKTDMISKLNWQNYNTIITGGGLNAVTYFPEMLPFPEITLPTFPTVNTLTKLSRYQFVVGKSKFDFINTSGNMQDTNSGTFANMTYTLPDAQNKDAYYVPKITISGNTSLTINVTKDTLLVVDELKLNGNFRVTGSGTLTIYVRSNAGKTTGTSPVSFSYGGSGGWVGNKLDSMKLLVYVDNVYTSGTTPATVNFGSGSIYYMSILALNLNFNIAGGGKIDGHVVTGGTSINVNGGASTAIALYYAPNANYTISGGAVINGAVIANNFTITGGSTLNYENVDFQNFPFKISVPFAGGTGSGTPVLELIRGSTIEQ